MGLRCQLYSRQLRSSLVLVFDLIVMQFHRPTLGDRYSSGGVAFEIELRDRDFGRAPEFRFAKRLDLGFYRSGPSV